MSKLVTKIVKEGDLVAEIKVELIEDESGWSPYLSPADAMKLDDARLALRKNDTVTAAKFGRVYRLTPV